jgi:mannose-6-phosphate isomerase-like protein (cupin superfamily)
MANVETTDVTVAPIDEMDPIHGGVARRARAELGVSAWGMQVLTLPPNWEHYPNHNHADDAFDPGQEEVYIPISGSATLVAGDERFELCPGLMARVGPEQLR